MSEIPFSAFTTKNNGIAMQLGNDGEIRWNGKCVKVKGLWDTGATGTCISKDVVQELGLTPTGMETIRTPSGSDMVNTYLLDIGLPNRVLIKDAKVCDSSIGDQGIGALIGMDVIVQGDFTVSNYNGKTIFTFCLPSRKMTDYVLELNVANTIGQKHGKGKAKKKK